MATFVEDFFELCESKDSDNTNNKNRASRSKNREWFKSLEFPNSTEAENFIRNAGMWSKCSTKKTLEGEKVEYRCKFGSYRKEECPAKVLLLFHSTSEKVSVFETESEHFHKKTSQRGLDEETKLAVKELFSTGIEKPNAVLRNLRKKGKPEPPKQKLITFIRQLRIKHNGPSTISAYELKQWCENNKEVPESLDTLFVLDYCVNCDPDNQELRIVISTKRLLDQLELSHMVQIDATYKLIWQGYHIIVTGTTDKNKVFHPFAIAICHNETEDDFHFVFSALKKHNKNWKPEYLLADGSAAITNGFVRTFGPPKVRLMCFFHVIQNIEKKLWGLEISAEVKKNINALQTCPNKEIFDRAATLFLEKWKSAPEFINYFETMWLKSYRNWFEGAASGYPSTNNGIESTNSVIKREHTLRERLPISQFLNQLKDLITKWSMDRNPQLQSYKIFAIKPTLTVKDFTESYHWALQNKKIIVVENTYYVCSSHSNYKNITPELVSKYIRQDWETFDEFENLFYSIWALNVNMDINKCNCTCPSFQKNYKCKHVLGLLIRLRKIDVPEEAKCIPLGQKRKRGRPSKAKKALIIQ